MNPFSGPVLHSFVYIIVFLAAWTINYVGSKSVAIVLSMTLTQNTEKKGQLENAGSSRKFVYHVKQAFGLDKVIPKKLHTHIVWSD